MKQIQELPLAEQKRFIKECFKDLKFNEELHRYSLPDRTIKKSVSTVIKDFIPKADFYNIAKNIDRKQGLPEGTTFRLWELKGKESTAKGNKAHFFGEVYAKYPVLQPETGYEVAVKSFIEDLPDYLEIAFTELVMYHKEYLFAGTMDLLLYNTKSNSYIVADYKTNADLYKSFGKLLHPFYLYDNNALNKYMLQLSTYQLMLEQTGVKVHNRVVVWLKPNGFYELIPVDDVTQELNKYYKKVYVK